MIPAPNTEWPPRHYSRALERIRENDMWLSGDMPAIRKHTKAQKQPYTVRAQYNGGMVGAAARSVFGRPPVREDGDATIQHHLPVAAALVSESANLLAAKPPAVTLDDRDADNQLAVEALRDLVDTDEFASDWWEAMRTNAGLGWVYGRIAWDVNVSGRPWIEWVDPDRGMCEFHHGQVTAVTFWDTYEREKHVYRLFQRHAPGVIEYRLMQGTDTDVGHVVPVTDLEEVAYLADLLTPESTIPTGTDVLTAGFFINLDRAHEWRNDPHLRYYGESDVTKGGGVWQDIDETWTDLRHETKVGRARILVDESLLESGGPGAGAYFDMARDIFTPVGQSASPDSTTLEPVQFQIRSEEYLRILDAAHRKAIDAVGLSPITVGMDSQATGDMTAHETRARSKRTINTHGGKARKARAGLSHMVHAYLQVDAAIHGYTPPQFPPNVALVEPVEDTPRDTAQRIGELHDRELASTEWAVGELHPEWTPEQVDEEIALIKARRAEGMPVDPFAGLGPDGVGVIGRNDD